MNAVAARLAKIWVLASGSLSLLLVLGICRAEGPIAVPLHALWAEDIALNVVPENNAYGSHPTFIRWPGVKGATVHENRTQCSSFVTHVLKQAYGWSDGYFKRWFGSTSPSAARYYDALKAENRFTRVETVDAIKAGDLIAMKYPAGSSATGHVMIARGAPSARVGTAPEIPGTYQYEIEVIDSSKSGHGPNDTRNQEDGSWDSGAGVGVVRLYADAAGGIVGYTWSTYKGSVYYDRASRPMVVGRLP
jgi:hypothetical protein